MKRSAWIVAAGLAVLLAGVPVAGEEKPSYVIVVNAANPESKITKEQLSALFLKSTARWSNGTAVLPVDQSVTSPAREAFSRDVFGQDVLMIQTFWQGEITSRRAGPPPVKASDRDVMVYVETTAGAIGYVSSDATLSLKIKRLKVTD